VRRGNRVGQRYEAVSPSMVARALEPQTESEAVLRSFAEPSGEA